MDDDLFVNAKDRIDQLLYGKEGVAAKRRQKELEHERELAAIRTQSHALIWTGTAEELTETIRRWYESGWLLAASLQDALQKAVVHFVDAAGKTIITPASVLPEQSTNPRFKSLDENYRIVELDGKQYDLTRYESTILRLLHKAHINKRGSVAIDDILSALRVSSGKMSNWFRGKNKPLRKIILHTGRQHYRLDL
jgi:hypothetical protein